MLLMVAVVVLVHPAPRESGMAVPSPDGHPGDRGPGVLVAEVHSGNREQDIFDRTMGRTGSHLGDHGPSVQRGCSARCPTGEVGAGRRVKREYETGTYHRPCGSVDLLLLGSGLCTV